MGKRGAPAPHGAVNGWYVSVNIRELHQSTVSAPNWKGIPEVFESVCTFR